MRDIHWQYYIILLLAGIIWGATIPASKIIISADLPIAGIIFWQAVFVFCAAGLLSIVQRASFRLNWTRIRLCLWVGLFGTVVPSAVGYWVIDHLPAGIFAITIAMVPIFVMPIALLLGSERFEWIRLLGVIAGAIAIVLLIGPRTSLPDSSKFLFILIALIAPLCYACEDNYVAFFGRDNMHPAAILCVSMGFSIIFITPITIARGEWFLIAQSGWGQAEITLLLLSVCHTIAYAVFLWLIGQTGPVFTSFVAYLVTGFGVIWSIVLLGERYSLWVWMSLGMMFIAMFMVQPRHRH